VGELLPPLPGDGVFAVDGLLAPPGTRLRDGLASCPSILPRNQCCETGAVWNRNFLTSGTGTVSILLKSEPGQ
jgi:hypothetical protein